MGPRIKSRSSSIQILLQQSQMSVTKRQCTPSPWTCPQTPITEPQRDPEHTRSWKVTFPKLFCWRTHFHLYSRAGNFKYDLLVQGVLPYQSLLDKKAEENGIAHFSEALEHIGLQLCILNDVLQLMVEKLQDSLKTRKDSQKSESRITLR